MVCNKFILSSGWVATQVSESKQSTYDSKMAYPGLTPLSCHTYLCKSAKFYSSRAYIMQGFIAERLSARQLILHRISASVCIYIYVSRLGMQLYCVLRMVWPALLWLSSHVLLPRVLAEVESWTTTARRVGKGLGILLHYAKESNERNTKPKLYKRPKSTESQDQRCVHLLANNCCSFSLEKQKSLPREFSPLEKDDMCHLT